MVDMIKAAAYIGSAAILYHGVTKDKVLTEEKVRNATLGALAGVLLGPKLEDITRNDKSLKEEEKNKILGTVIGAGVGGGAGYILTNKILDYLSKELKKYKAAQVQTGTNTK